jgi:hypothetical protein
MVNCGAVFLRARGVRTVMKSKHLANLNDLEIKLLKLGGLILTAILLLKLILIEIRSI